MIYILTEGDRKKGFGHVARCYALYQALADEGAEVSMLVDGSEEAAGICDGNCEISDWSGMSVTGDDVVIIDSYHAELSVYKRLSDEVAFCIYFDDYGRLNYPKGWIINPAGDGEKGFYGLKHAVLRRDFWAMPEKEIKQSIEKVLIALGSGADVQFTLAVADSVREILGVEPIIFAQGVEGAVYGLTGAETAELLSSCDIAFTAGGQTMLELAACGVPSVIVKTADNQEKNIDALKGATVYIGEIEGLTAEEYVKSAVLLTSDKTRRIFSRKSRDLVDGKGAGRIAKFIMDKRYESL